MSEAVVALTIVVVIVKDLSYLWAICALVHDGGRHVREMREGSGALRVNAPAVMNPVDRFLSLVIPQKSCAGKWLLAMYKTPVVVTTASVLVFAVGPRCGTGVQVILGIAIAVCSILALITAVLRRLVFGSRDWETSDVQIPKVFSEWAVSTEPGANNSVYFLVLVYISIVGFTALYFSMESSDSSAFAHFGSVSVITALYVSITTLATVGYGDIHAASDLARVAVIIQISTGPLLLSWLLSALMITREGHSGTKDDVGVRLVMDAAQPPDGSSSAGGRGP